MTVAIYCLFAIAGLAISISMMKTGHFITMLFLTALQGITALFAAKYVGGFFGIGPSVNAHTLIMSTVGGIPSVIFLFVAGALFK